MRIEEHDKFCKPRPAGYKKKCAALFLLEVV